MEVQIHSTLRCQVLLSEMYNIFRKQCHIGPTGKRLTTLRPNRSFEGKVVCVVGVLKPGHATVFLSKFYDPRLTPMADTVTLSSHCPCLELVLSKMIR